jgi:hypothetical protein
MRDAQWIIITLYGFILCVLGLPLETNRLNNGDIIRYKNGTIWNIDDPTGLARYKNGTTELIYRNLHIPRYNSILINGTKLRNSTTLSKRQSGSDVYIDYYWDGGCSDEGYELDYNRNWCSYDYYLAGSWSNQMVWSDYGFYCDVWSGPNFSGTYLGKIRAFVPLYGGGWTYGPNCLGNNGLGATTFRCGAC